MGIDAVTLHLLPTEEAETDQALCLCVWLQSPEPGEQLREFCRCAVRQNQTWSTNAGQQRRWHETGREYLDRRRVVPDRKWEHPQSGWLGMSGSFLP